MNPTMRNRYATLSGYAPPRPDIVHEVVELVNDPSTSVARLAATVGKDKALTNMILRKANSSYYGFSGRVTNVNFALVLLGFNALRETVTHALVNSAFRNLVGVMFSYEELWNHSLACGLLARRLATRTHSCDPDEAFIAGLLHDVGYVVLDRQASTHNAAHIKVKLKGNDEYQGMTISELALTHEDAGSLLASQWNLPPAIGEAIRHHHRPEFAKRNPFLVAVVHVADVLCRKLPWGLLEDPSNTAVHPKMLELLQLDESLFSEQSLNEMSDLLKSELDHAPTFEQLVGFFKETIVNTVEQMDPDKKVVIALHYSEGLSFTEIAQVLRRHEEDVVSVHNEAMTLLRQAMQSCL